MPGVPDVLTGLIREKRPGPASGLPGPPDLDLGPEDEEAYYKTLMSKISAYLASHPPAGGDWLSRDLQRRLHRRQEQLRDSSHPPRYELPSGTLAASPAGLAGSVPSICSAAR